jgi:hypothetical protein
VLGGARRKPLVEMVLKVNRTQRGLNVECSESWAYVYDILGLVIQSWFLFVIAGRGGAVL